MSETFDAEEQLTELVKTLVFDLPAPMMLQLKTISDVREMIRLIRLDEQERFYERVCARAEANMLKTGKLEGAHFAAMQTEIKASKQAS